MLALLKGKFDSFDWTLKCDLSFRTLKSILTQILVFTIMDLLKENIVLCINASDLARQEGDCL